MSNEDKPVLIKDIYNLDYMKAGDNTILTEVMHPFKDKKELPYSLAFAKLLKGASSLPHVLNNEELYIFIKGYGSIHIEQDVYEVKEGMTVLVPAGKAQYVKNRCEGELEFYCIVSPPWSAEKEEILK